MRSNYSRPFCIVVAIAVLSLVQCCSGETYSFSSIITNSIATIQHRFLEDGQPNEGSDLSSFTVSQGHCFRMKIENNNDDDGNAYFYNGAYRSQYKRYISYTMCNSSTNKCYEYVIGLNEYLEQTVPFVQQYCTSCAATCRRRRQLGATSNSRSLEEQMNIDCSKCSDHCSLLNTDKGNDGNDESEYIDCIAAGNDENGLEYYTAPQCESDHVVIGRFYDNECTIKTTKSADSGFSYNTFATIERLALPCMADNSQTCYDLLDNNVAVCSNGVAADNGNDDQNANSICKAAAAAGKVYTYYKKPFRKAPIILLCLGIFILGFALGFLSYTYYVRHRRSAMIPMASLDGAPTSTLPNEYDPNNKHPLPNLS